MMTKDEIIEIYIEVSNKLCNGTEWCWAGVGEPLQLFAKLVAEREREACAKLCDLAMLQNQEAINELEEDEHVAKCFIQGAMTQLVKTSKAIRERGQANG